MDEKMNESELKQQRAELILMLGEETHSKIRAAEFGISENMRNISEKIQRVDINLSKLINNEDPNVCPQCKSPIGSADAAFCTNCGFAIKTYFNQFTGQCGFCGTNITDEQVYCDACGTKLK